MAREQLPPLTDRQREVYEWFAQQSTLLRLCPVSVRGMDHFGLSRATFERHVGILLTRGYLKKTPCGRLYIPMEDEK